MHLQVTPGSHKHSQYVTGCGWVGTELYTCSDDKTVHKISADGDDLGKVTDLDSCPTDLHWFPSGENRTQEPSSRPPLVRALQIPQSRTPECLPLVLWTEDVVSFKREEQAFWVLGGKQREGKGEGEW